jgi:hypothetical protein
VPTRPRGVHVDGPGTPWGLAALVFAWGSGWLAATWACWTGRWKGLAYGHTGDLWNTFLPAHGVGMVLTAVVLVTGWVWLLVPALAVFVLGLVLLVVQAFVDLDWIEPAWVIEERDRLREWAERYDAGGR